MLLSKYSDDLEWLVCQVATSLFDGGQLLSGKDEGKRIRAWCSFKAKFLEAHSLCNNRGVLSA